MLPVPYGHIMKGDIHIQLKGQSMRLNPALLTSVSLLLLGMSALQAQTSETCPAPVIDAVHAIGTMCDNLDRNSACYGSDHVDATFSQPFDASTFDQPSDRAALDLFQSIVTAPLNASTGQWGAAVLKLQANIPNTLPGQVVTLLLLGDTQVQNVADPTTQTPMQAFNFVTGIALSCAQVPPSSLVLQGPRGMVVDLTINGARVRLGSTAVLRMDGGRAEFTTLDGRVVVDDDVVISKGFWASAELDDDGLIVEDSWSEAELMDNDELSFLETFDELPDEVFEYELDVPEAEEIELLEAFDPDLIESLDPYTLDEMLTTLLEDGVDPTELADLSDDDYYQFLYEALYAADPLLGDTFYEAATGEDVNGDGLIAGFDAEAYYSDEGFYRYDDDLADATLGDEEEALDETSDETSADESEDGGLYEAPPAEDDPYGEEQPPAEEPPPDEGDGE
jgi:hypothetical protein